MYEEGNQLRAKIFIVLVSRAQPTQVEPVQGRHESYRMAPGLDCDGIRLKYRSEVENSDEMSSYRTEVEVNKVVDEVEKMKIKWLQRVSASYLPGQ